MQLVLLFTDSEKDERQILLWKNLNSQRKDRRDTAKYFSRRSNYSTSAPLVLSQIGGMAKLNTVVFYSVQKESEEILVKHTVSRGIITTNLPILSTLDTSLEILVKRIDLIYRPQSAYFIEHERTKIGVNFGAI